MADVRYLQRFPPPSHCCYCGADLGELEREAGCYDICLACRAAKARGWLGRRLDRLAKQRFESRQQPDFSQLIEAEVFKGFMPKEETMGDEGRAGGIVDVPSPARAIVRMPEAPNAGLAAMARMSDVDFAEHLKQLKQGVSRIRQIKQEIMEEDSHYGNLPGVNKPALLKPGAELLCSVYHLRPDFVPDIQYGDGEHAPAVSVTMRCELHLEDMSGPVVAVGYGAANSWERKHRYRAAERACPACGSEGTVRRSGFPNKDGEFRGEKGWWCKACKTNWDNPKESTILEQQVGMVENKDPYDLLNTLVKMAKKRAHVDATLTGTASSDLFTQDVEEDTTVTERAEKATTKNGAAKKGEKKAGKPPSETPSCIFCASIDIVINEQKGYGECKTCGKGWQLGRG